MPNTREHFGSIRRSLIFCFVLVLLSYLDFSFVGRCIAMCTFFFCFIWWAVDSSVDNERREKNRKENETVDRSAFILTFVSISLRLRSKSASMNHARLDTQIVFISVRRDCNHDTMHQNNQTSCFPPMTAQLNRKNWELRALRRTSKLDFLRRYRHFSTSGHIFEACRSIRSLDACTRSASSQTLSARQSTGRRSIRRPEQHSSAADHLWNDPRLLIDIFLQGMKVRRERLCVTSIQSMVNTW